jgi:hypothetical protein
VSIAPDVTPVPIMSHANFGHYLIVIDIISLQHVKLLGVDVTMYIIDNCVIPRSRYLRKITLNTYLESGNELYEHQEDGEEVVVVEEEEEEEDEEEDEELMGE